MLDAKKWVKDLADKLVSSFGERLLFIGFQGSYRRGEATEESDIDVVAILDSLALKDLGTYRNIVSTMPESEKACGFIAGRNELRGWPKHEIFQMKHDTTAVHGSLDGLLPDISRPDIEESVRISASALYHALCHTYIYGSKDEKTEILKTAYKSAFFTLQLASYLRNGIYCETKPELLEELGDGEKRLIETGIDIKKGKDLGSEQDMHFDRLINWTSGLIGT